MFYLLLNFSYRSTDPVSHISSWKPGELQFVASEIITK